MTNKFMKENQHEQHGGNILPCFRQIIRIMRLILFFIVVNSSMIFSALSYSQNTKLSVNLKNATVKEVIKAIENQSDILFFYREGQIDLNRRVSIHSDAKQLKEILDEIFNGTDNIYIISDRQVVIGRAPRRELKAQLTALQKDIKTIIEQPQQKEITGLVTDSSGEPLPGVTIVVKGTTKGTITDTDGRYSLRDVPGNATLVFSFVGMKNQELPVSGKAVINIVMEEESIGLNEVLVVGYGEMRRKDLTGSVSSLDPNEIESTKYSSIDKLMQGRVAGVSVSSTTSTPGAAVSVIIRGANSFRGDNQPLYVIDNVPIASTTQDAATAFGSDDLQIAQNPLLSIDPQDIESVEILKDASATAIYGSRGANGVVLITTKKGKEGAARISFTSNLTVSQSVNLHHMLGLKDYASYQNAQENSLAATQYFFAGDEVRYVYSGKGESYDANNPNTYFVLEEHNWQDEVYRSAFSQNYGLNVSGGDPTLKYFLSAGYKDIRGLVSTTGMKQGNVRLNLLIKLTRRLDINVIAGSSVRTNDMMQGGDLLKGGASGSITRAAIDAAPHIIPADETTEIGQRITVYSWLDDYDDLTKDKNFNGSADIHYKLSDAISYNLRMGGNMRFMNRARWYGLETFKGNNENGSLGISDLTASNYTIENLLNFNKKFNRVFRLNSVIGATYDDYNSLNKLYYGKDFDIYILRTKGMQLANNAVVETPAQKDYQLASFLGRGNMVFFDGRYIATVNFRADGSSKFQKKKWGYFPSLALAWGMQEEKFIQNLAIVDQLKLRAGWGITGNQGISPYSTINDYTISGNTYANEMGEKELAASLSRLANTDLTWETTEAWNAGMDFSLFKNRLSGSLDVYKKITKDLLIEKEIPGSAGFSSIVVNQGKLQNRGVELVLSGDLIRTKKIDWEVSGNISFNKGKVLDIGLPKSEWGIHTLKAFSGSQLGQSYYQEAPNIFAEGFEPALFWGYKTDGIVQDKSDLAYTDAEGNTGYTTYSIISGGNDPQPGDVKFVDLNHDGVVNDLDKTFIGNPNPDFTYGFQTNFSYGGFILSVQFTGVHGNNVLNANRYTEFQPGIGTTNIRQEVYDHAWTAENKSNLYPSVTSQRFGSISDLIIEDGSYLRCSDVSLSYDIPMRFTHKLSLSKINLFISGQNLFIITHYKGYDPDVNSFAFDGLRQGIDWNGFPSARAFSFGFNVTF